MEFKNLSPISWETERDEFDFHIRLEEDDYVIDVFNSFIESADDAHLTTHTCDTWEEVVAFCTNYDGISVF
jgi:uncharacterized FAD-dependent dehydrogenase